ncbi:MAG TPA: peptidylprolyl isomerase [Gemmatimonadales bacterium]|nr:peptidylprolyl isomerase [Gemmatimonadales bacterium]
MAVMQLFRSSAKLAGVVLGILMLIFVVQLSGVFDGGPTLFTRTNAGRVNGQPVELRAYEAAVQQAVEQRQRGSTAPLTLEDVQAVRDEVWSSIVDDLVLRSEYDRFHLVVSDEEVADAVRNVPPQELAAQPEFQTDGQFDMAKYQRWLTGPVGQQLVPALEARYRAELFRSKLLRVVTADVYLSDAALWQRWRDENEQVRIGMAAVIPRTAVPDSAVSVSDAEVEAYYRGHREDLERPEAVWLSYIAAPRFLAAADTAAALERARTVRAEIAGGAPFAEVAGRESSDEVSAAQGGSLGTFGRGAMVPAFDSVAFSLPLGTLSEPFETQFGYHVVEVTARTADSATARHVLIPIELAGARRDSIEARADSLEQIGADRLEPAALDSAARALGLPILTAGPVQKGARVLVGRFVVPDAGIWAFRAKEGETSPVIETEAAYYLFRVDSSQAAGVPPLAEVRDEVRRAVRDGKKTEQARPIAETLVRRVREGSTLAQAAQAMGLPYQELGPFPRVNPPVGDPTIVGTAFGLGVGGTSGVLETPGGLQVLTVLARTGADSAAFRAQMEEWRVRQITLARQDRVRNYLETLRTEAKVVDRRAQLDRTNAQAEAEAGALQGVPGSR